MNRFRKIALSLLVLLAAGATGALAQTYGRRWHRRPSARRARSSGGWLEALL